MLEFTNYQNEIIGYGLQVPYSFDEASGKTVSNTGIARINQSIHHILSTRVGSRFFLPEFGSKLYKLIFEPNDYILKEFLIQYTKEALAKWEKRINNISVDALILEKESEVPVYIAYTLINTNVTGNYIYPFNRETYEPGTYATEY